MAGALAKPQQALIEVTDREPLPTYVPATIGSDVVILFERLAKDPTVSPEKLERLVALQEHIIDRNAEAAFNVAFVAMQNDLPEIEEHGGIKNKDGEIQSRYAKWEDIKRAITPILARHGFSLRHKTEFPTEKSVKVTAFLTHAQGHCITSEFLSAADTSGNKNAIQALGSASSYGKRYSAIDVTGITSREPERRDDDGRSSENYKKPETPAEVTELLAALERGVGTPKFFEPWNKADAQIRQFITKHKASEWNDLKAAHLGATKGRE